MGIENPEKQEKKAILRFLFPIFASLFLALLPIFAQTIYSTIFHSNTPVATKASVDLSSFSSLDMQNTSIRGDVELYYNQWIVSEPSPEPSSVYVPTPGTWVGKDDGKGGTFDRFGYGSYRYVLTGLKPNLVITPVQNIDVPSRIYLNRELCFSVGSPSKEIQIPVSYLRDNYVSYLAVPSSGIVEVVVEVGNCGVGGINHLDLVVERGASTIGFTNRVVAPFLLGSIIVLTATMVVLVIFSKTKKPAVALAILSLSTIIVHLFSRDSLIIGGDLIYGAALFSNLSLVGFSGTIIGLLLYGLWSRGAVLRSREFYILFGLTVLMLPLSLLLLNTPFQIIVAIIGLVVPLIVYVKSFICHIKRRGNLALMMLSGTIVGYSLVALVFTLDILPAEFIIHPTVFIALVSIELLLAGFADILSYSIVRRNEAILDHRYKTISNRALAKLATESEVNAALEWIGEGYEKSTDVGDKHLLWFSDLMRRRLHALRKQTIPLMEDAGLESALFRYRCALLEKTFDFVLDIEEGSIEVPPLIFEAVIAEILRDLQPDESVMISDDHKVARLIYPSHIQINEGTENSILGRCKVCGLLVAFHQGSIVISKETRR